MKVLIIEDEIAAARGLRKMLKRADSTIEFLGLLTSVKEALTWFDLNPEPDLIFLDIQLKDGLSFKIFERTIIFSPIIFCTAFDQYAIRAFKLNSIDYLLKPYNQDELKFAIKKYLNLVGQHSSVNYKELARVFHTYKSDFKERFLVKAGSKFYHVLSEQIAFFYTRDKVNFIRTKNDQQYVIDEYLDELEQGLDPTIFFRINRQFIVSLDAIISLQKDYGRYYVQLSPSIEAIAISRSRVAEFKKWLGQTRLEKE